MVSGGHSRGDQSFCGGLSGRQITRFNIHVGRILNTSLREDNVFIVSLAAGHDEEEPRGVDERGAHVPPHGIDGGQGVGRHLAQQVPHRRLRKRGSRRDTSEGEQQRKTCSTNVIEGNGKDKKTEQNKNKREGFVALLLLPLPINLCHSDRTPGGLCFHPPTHIRQRFTMTSRRNSVIILRVFCLRVSSLRSRNENPHSRNSTTSSSVLSRSVILSCFPSRKQLFSDKNKACDQLSWMSYTALARQFLQRGQIRTSRFHTPFRPVPTPFPSTFQFSRESPAVAPPSSSLTTAAGPDSVDTHTHFQFPSESPPPASFSLFLYS